MKCLVALPTRSYTCRPVAIVSSWEVRRTKRSPSTACPNHSFSFSLSPQCPFVPVSMPRHAPPIDPTHAPPTHALPLSLRCLAAWAFSMSLISQVSLACGGVYENMWCWGVGVGVIA